MPLDTQTLCKYRLERAEEDLLTAESNHESGFYKAAINRSLTSFLFIQENLKRTFIS